LPGSARGSTKHYATAQAAGDLPRTDAVAGNRIKRLAVARLILIWAEQRVAWGPGDICLSPSHIAASKPSLNILHSTPPLAPLNAAV
jgi:hypothetical protein